MALGTHQLVLQTGDKSVAKIDLLTIKKADIILRTLNHTLRLQIIKLLFEKGELTVTEIYADLRLEQSVASQHLALLRRAGIVVTRRTGKFIWYSLNIERILGIHELSKQLINQA